MDPGSYATGYGVIASEKNAPVYVNAGVIRMSGDENFFSRLDTIYTSLRKIIKESRPDVAGIEKVFSSKNPKSSLILGHARGVAILAAVHEGLEVYEYTPTEVKLAVAGYGRADKKQIQQMVKVILNLQKAPAQDASDALAVAICHAHSSETIRKYLS
jgi:crossover junction endodeoxyribonuclease RuvC